MDVVILTISAFTFGFVVGHITFAIKMRNTLEKVAKQHGIELDSSSTEIFNSKTKRSAIRIPNLVTETLTNSVLLYDFDTGNFIAQADTMAELAEQAYRFNKINFAHVQHDDKKIYFVEGKIRDNLKEI